MKIRTNLETRKHMTAHLNIIILLRLQKQERDNGFSLRVANGVVRRNLIP